MGDGWMDSHPACAAGSARPAQGGAQGRLCSEEAPAGLETHQKHQNPTPASGLEGSLPGEDPLCHGVLLPRDPISLQPCPCPCPAEPRAAARPCPAGIKLFLGPASCFPAARACSKAINLCLWLQWPGTGRAVSALPAAAPEQGRIPLEPTTPEGSWSWRQLLTPLQTRD